MAEERAGRLTPAVAMGGVEATYKARDVEGLFDIYFYRNVGFAFARLFAALKISPNSVSALGAVTGIVAGHLYYYASLPINCAGMLLHVLTNTLDNADGQLARLTNSGSATGRIVDGIADYVVFLSVYLHLALRYVHQGGSPAVWLLALAAGASHAAQSLVADLFRDAYLRIVIRQRVDGADSVAAIRGEDEKVEWSQVGKKIMSRLYLNYTLQQEALAPGVSRLRRAIRERFAGNVPLWFATAYRQLCQPIVRTSNFLATNTRMMVLFLFLLLRRPVWYFVVEVLLLNLLLVYVLRSHSRAMSLLLSRIEDDAHG